MNSLRTTDFRKSGQVAKKSWLYMQEANAASVPAVPGWNEGYVASNKFLYFSKSIAAAPERELKSANRIK